MAVKKQEEKHSLSLIMPPELQIVKKNCVYRIHATVKAYLRRPVTNP